MIEFLTQPWPWWFSGAMIGLTLWVMWFAGKTFGFSGNFRTMCTMCGAGKAANFFAFDWKTQKWNLAFLVGAMIGGYLAAHFLSPEGGQIPAIDAGVQAQLQGLGFAAPAAYQPLEWYGEDWFLGGTLWLLLFGGFLIGFGSRYSGGCTSGHAITGLSSFQLPSLIAVVGFFIGGLFMTHVIYPWLLG